jgi:hypothetical protein
MNTPTITMPVEQAKAKLRAYRSNLHKDAEAEYAAAAQGYEALAAGRTLISLTEAIRAGGFDEKMRPKLAVARADRREVEFKWQSHRNVATFDTRKGTVENDSLAIRVDMGRSHDVIRTMRDGSTWSPDVRGFAMVPMVPADVRPATGQLREWFILWEVEQWSDTRLTAPPRDPYLLQHIGGDLYAVLAEWDLTDLERTIMAGIRRAEGSR